MNKRLTLSYAAALVACMLWCASAWSQTLPANAVNSSKQYRQSGVGNATGRAGAASMAARALLGKDGNTTVELTTNPAALTNFDAPGTPPGAFSKVQFKPLTQLGNALYAQNFTANTTTGYYKFVTPSAYRAEQVQVQANITGIDRNRTDVVTLVETVKRRPDLVVQNLMFKSSAPVNQAVNISANVVEMNGDAGATTTCVLAIDGSNVDSVKNVYVDTGGSVSCAFAYTFTTTGTHSIQVSATNVVPADWDTSNNSASGNISIVSPDSLQHAFAYFYFNNGGFPIVETDTTEVWNAGNIIQNTSDSYGQKGAEQGGYAEFYNDGCGNAFPAFQFPATVAETETMDGTQVYAFADAGITGATYTFVESGSICGAQITSVVEQQGSDYSVDHWSYVVSYQYLDSGANVVWTEQDIQTFRYAGDVTYFSSGYQCYWNGSPGSNCNNPADYYTWNSSSTNVYGTLVRVGSTWVPSIAVQDAAGNTASGSISVPLSPQTINQYQSNTCQNYGPDANSYTYQYCQSYNYNFTQNYGSASK
jgi:hypothetical protein